VNVNPKAPPTGLTERQLDQLWIEQERATNLARANASRARTFAPQRCRFTRLKPVHKASPGLALCLFLATVGAVGLFATGAWPFVRGCWALCTSTAKVRRSSRRVSASPRQ
jgi:hypothetical protein